MEIARGFRTAAAYPTIAVVFFSTHGSGTGVDLKRLEQAIEPDFHLKAFRIARACVKEPGMT